MMGRTAWACALALVLSAAARAGENPRLDLRNVRLTLTDGKLAGSLDYTLVVGTYHEWNTDPTAVPGLMSEVSRRTAIKASVGHLPIALDEDRIRRNPLLIMTGNRFFKLSEAECANLQKYLRAGGFIYADDCGGADRSFRDMIKQLLPEADLVELPPDHPIYSAPYKLQGVPKILDLYRGPAKGYGACLDHRLAIFYTYDTDVPCGWEKNPDGSFVHMLDRDKHELSYQFGANVLTYVLTELYRREVAPKPPATAVAALPVQTGLFLPGTLRTFRMQLQLPCNLIQAIVPAGRYVWFGGRRMLPGEQEGLARFDYQTERWELFLDSEGVLADEINCMAKEPSGLWIGTSTIWQRWNHGLWRYDPAAKRSRRYTTDDGLVDNDVYDVAVDGDDVYAATRSGLARFNCKTGRWSKDPDHSQNFIDFTLCLAVDDRYVWAGRGLGLRRYDKRQGTYQLFDASNSPVTSMVNVLVNDGETLWVSSPPDLLTYRKGQFSAPAEGRPIAKADILCGATDGKLVCLGTRNAGLHVLDKATGKWRVLDKTSGLPIESIRKVALDDRSIWCALGDNPLGLARYDRKAGKWSFYTHRAGIPCNHVYCLAACADGLYVGTMANGLWEYDPVRDHWINLELNHRADNAPVRRADVYAFLPQEHDLWFGTNVGLCRHHYGSDTYEPAAGLNASVAALCLDGPNVLCGTRQLGLMAYDPARKSWTDIGKRYGIEGRSITALTCDARGIWAGTEEGLLLLDKTTLKTVPLPRELTVGPITALLLLENVMYVGTPAGLLRYDTRTRTVTSTPISGSHVLSILPVREGLLVGTRTGLALMPRDDTPTVFDKRLADQVVGALAADDKWLWIGTLGHGLVRADRKGPSPP